MRNWIKNYFATLYSLELNTLITDQNGSIVPLDEGFSRYIQCVKSVNYSRGKLMFIGNGGSAAIASHLAIDYSKNGHIPAITLTDASAVTCLSNDYGYENVFAKQIEFHGRKEDILVAISSSGRSPNIHKAIMAANMVGCRVITFSGFDAENPLRKLGHLNFYISSKENGFVEVGHLALGHAMLDYIIEERCRQMETNSRPSLVIE